MKKLAILLALALASFSFAADKIQPTRVGPVSQYGQLLAGKTGQKGQIYGSCKGVTSGNEVVVQGMSLFWSMDDINGSPFWNADYVTGLVNKQKIQLIRAPMGVDDAWDGAQHYFTNGMTATYQSLMDAVVESAIKNDIYVIIDYHSHKASDNVTNAKTFFSRMAQKWGDYDNVIFEVFNEPIYQSWGTVKNYANEVVAEIRKYSDNLIVVGSPLWSSTPNSALGSTVTGTNIAYTFHFYAAYDDENGHHEIDDQGQNAVNAMNGGLSVFVTEWGNSGPNGKGEVIPQRSKAWYDWMKDNKLSGANWSVSTKGESASYFDGSAWNYSTSGLWVNENVFADLPSTYTDCSGLPASSSSSSDNAVIDDFEDGNAVAESLGENAPWYLYEAGGSITNTPPAAEDEPWDMIFTDGENTYAAMKGISGIVYGSDENEIYTSVGMGLEFDEGVLANCTAIQYDYKGSGHRLRGLVHGVTPDKGYEHVSIDQASSSDWTTVTVTVMNQPSWVKKNSPSDANDFAWDKVSKLAWVVDEKISGMTSELDIDNVKCVGTLPEVEIPSSSSTTPKSSSSSHVNPTCEDGETIDVGSTHMLCVDGEWTEVEVSSSSAVSTVVMIDDVDDGNTGVESLGEDGYWFLYTAGGSISNTQGADEVWDMVRGNSSNYYVAMEGISDITFGDESYPSVGMSMNIPASALAGCSAIQYEYKGSGHMFRAAMSTVTAKKGYEHATTAKDKATSWTPVTVSVSDLKQPTWIPATEKKNFSWELVYQLVWVVDEKIKDAQRGTYLDVDNVQCVGSMPNVEGSSSSGTAVSSSSAAAECTEGAEIHVGSSDLKCVDGKWTEMNASSSSGSPNSSASTPGIALIDDFQDENTQAESLGEAYWYIYTAGGSVTNTPGSTTKPWDMVRTEGTNAYVAMEGISGITYESTKYPSVGMGVDVPTSAFANCTAITYEYRGSAHKFRASLSTVTPDEGYEHVTAIQPKATAWTSVTVTKSDLEQPTWIPATEKKNFSWAQVVKMAWVVDEKIPNADRGTNLDIDNVQCVGSLLAPKSSSSSTKPNSSSSVKPGSSSSVNPGSSSGTGTNPNGSNSNGNNNGGANGNGYDNYGMAVGDIASATGLHASVQGNTLVVSVARAGLVKVQVFDMMGHSIESHSESMAAGSFAHDFAKLNKGAYIVRVRQGSMVKTIRMQVR
jgi:hypothetical protein